MKFTTASTMLAVVAAASGTARVAAFMVRPPSTPTSSSFVAKTHGIHNALQTTNAAASSTALQMNLFDRFSRVAKSNLNNILQNLEDPEKIMNQAVEDMQQDLVKVRQSYAEVTATQRRLLKQKEQSDAMSNDWYERAQLALKSGKEELAREALNRRQQYVDESAQLQDQIDGQADSIDKLYEGMQMLEAKILEAKSKKEQMVARARTAQTTQKVNDMLSGVTGKSSMDAFNRMEDKVASLEASAEISAEMGAIGGNALPGTAASSIENEFKKLEASSAVDDELNKLKGLIGGSSDADAKSSASKPPSSANKALDDEFEKLKKDAGL
mmetsp:Transcript_6629/g.18000  ORF Transcript_6629/g.18000 Transcript_6629/m.18000 type:complete len:327 (-) Transcript_6629:1755-2735(-)|eukprot:CAMPEP_0198132202 /NCGR_PEP_ID=MMETSP1442-20131203/57804_1 /TAXON_ID= /ORGANISM="Craspedostauros australis, Strain CCMP3328" /LENGTH=326 /DNA_ID=CAMNT_0043793149 /DNA_START=89 /DNA_END=1069 /DNA_ORIENTATION=+